MKRFIRQLFLFVSIPLFYFVANMVINYYNYTSTPVNLNNVSVLIAGDSHPEKSINPNRFKSAKNISQGAEPYVLTYWKLKKIYESHQPDTLILGFSIHNFSQFNDYKFSSKRWSIEMFKRSYPIQNFMEIKGETPVDYFEFFKVFWNQTAYYPKKKHVNYIGSYSNSKHSDLTDWKTAIERHYYWEEKTLGVSDVSVNYLDKIIEMSQQHGITVILSGNPVYSKYYDNIPTPIVKAFYALKEKYKSQVIIFDKTKNVSYPDSLFLNADHLNEYGDKRFTGELITYLNKLNRIN